MASIAKRCDLNDNGSILLSKCLLQRARLSMIRPLKGVKRTSADARRGCSALVERRALVKAACKPKPLSRHRLLSGGRASTRGVGSAFGHRCSVATAFPLTRVSPASCQCRALRLGLAQALAPLTEPVPAGTLRFPEGVAEVSMVPPRSELAPALVLASWTGLVEVPLQDLPRRGSELPLASPVLD
jgi:hypothetical protein